MVKFEKIDFKKIIIFFHNQDRLQEKVLAELIQNCDLILFFKVFVKLNFT